MTSPHPAGRHRSGRHHVGRRRGGLALLVLVVAAIGVAGMVLALPSPAPAAPSTASGSRVPISVLGGTASESPEPSRVRVPGIGVDSRLVRLGVDREGALVPPEDFARAGWFTGGPAPGETGPAVIAGHVDSHRGPAVFFRLAELEDGDEVLVDRADGTTARFRVTSVDRYPKDAFPTEQVYGPTPRAELRLITCGGEFDPDARSYRDNVVVSAVVVP